MKNSYLLDIPIFDIGIGLLTHSMLTVHHGLCKGSFIIDQQIARHFVHYSECLSNPPFTFMQLK